MPVPNCLKRLWIIWVAFCLALPTSYSLHAQQDPSSAVDRYVQTRMREINIPGLSLAVLQDGKVLKTAGYGAANIETQTSATPETVYRIASLSKQFIAGAILLLVQDGKIRLDDKAAQYLDQPPAAWQDITLRQLLTHTSGIPRDPADYHPYVQQPITDVIRAAYALPLSFQPGTGWLYSNVGYYVLAEVITKASGEPWDNFIAHRLFAPAGMTATRIATLKDIVPHRASGYTMEDNHLVNAEAWIALRPSAAFLSNIIDMEKWDQFLDSQNPFSSENRKLMWTPAALNDKTSTDYGFGWYIDPYLGESRIHHDGQYPGFRADYERFPNEKLSVILLANTDTSSLQSLAIKIAGFYAKSLETPSFQLAASVATQPGRVGNPLEIEISATDQGKLAPDSVVEMEIWDSAGKAVYKQDVTHKDFAAGQKMVFRFSWTPEKAGPYSVNIGAYGAHWTLSYTWTVNAATIEVK
jgi:CubicO group peptidase (beta-lactamase class C family)